jgi:hypothetical protein
MSVSEMVMLSEKRLMKSRCEDSIALNRKRLSKEVEIVFIGTNRWMPDKCMWTIEKKLFRQNVTIVFPFPELSASICHIFVGTSDSHLCFIHLTPLTSLFRESTSELEKIMANLADITGENQCWHFQVYFFADNDNELKFRNTIAQVLGKENVNYIAMRPKGYRQGEINLLYHRNEMCYSTQNTNLLLAHSDASSIGSYNKIPIDAYE